MIPLLAKVRIKPRNHSVFGIWIPLFLLWLILLPLAVVTIPLVLLTAAFMWKQGTGRKIFNGCRAIAAIIFCMSGLKVDVESEENIIFLNFI